MMLIPAAASSAAEILCVDARNTTGTETGTTQRPFTTIQAALDAAATGDTVKVAQGTYAENLVIDNKAVELLGGYAGGTTQAYAGNTAGDFATQNPTASVTTINGANDAPTIQLLYTDASGTVIDGFTIRGGSRGIEFDTALTFPHIGDTTISRNTFEDNGIAEYERVGGGLFVDGDNNVIEDNIFRNNVSGRGAGAAFFGEDNVFQRNLVESNLGYADHAGGLYQGGTATISDNIVRGNRIGEDIGYGWGGGIVVLGDATLTRNVWTGNYAPGIGGAVFVDDGATATLDHELIYGNSAHRGAAVYVDGYSDNIASHVQIIHCTIAGNTADEQDDGNAVYVEQNSTVTLKNSIAWGNGGDDFAADGTSTITATYTLSEEVIAGTGNLVMDPLFADAGGGDFHLRSTAGRFDPAKGAGAFVMDGVNSPAIDAADPASPFGSEPAPNGGRANLGAYGNTDEASKSGGGIVEGEPDGEGAVETYHSADTSGDGAISLSELLRVIQFYNQGGLYCAALPEDSEDGFVAGTGADHSCTPHDSDYKPTNWMVSLAELLRLIQLYNALSYTECPDANTEDGFCLGS